MEIAGSVAVVTGAGSGIGRALALSLADAGASVVVGDLDGAAATATRITDAAGGKGVGVTADASTVDGIAALIGVAREQFGPVDVYVANAGIMGAAGLGDDEADWDRILDVNLRAHVRAAKALVPEWIVRGSGHFVAVASAAGLLTQLGAAGYSVTKHAAVGIRGVALDHLRRQRNRGVMRLPDGRGHPAAERHRRLGRPGGPDGCRGRDESR